jgi:hypothetical protein
MMTIEITSIDDLNLYLLYNEEVNKTIGHKNNHIRVFFY